MSSFDSSIREVLAQFSCEFFSAGFITEKCVRSLSIEGHDVLLVLQWDFPVALTEGALLASLESFLAKQFPDFTFSIQFETQIVSHAVRLGVASHPQIKNVIAVASGKGGVGKSTTATHLALALQAAGAQVGLMDGDIYGPNIPTMLGGRDKPKVNAEKKFDPVMCRGVQSNSIGYLVADEQAMIWRGPMVSGALMQLFNDTAWRSLDYLIIDLPPGTGDVQLTLAKQIPVAGVVIVTTPQKVATDDAQKAMQMFSKVEIPILGVVENMSAYTCSHCDEKTYPFGEGGGARLAKEKGVPLLAEIPLEPAIRVEADSGNLYNAPYEKTQALYRQLALRVTIELAKRPKNHALKFQSVIVEQGSSSKL